MRLIIIHNNNIRNSSLNVQLQNPSQAALQASNLASNSYPKNQVCNLHRSSNDQETSRLETQNLNANAGRSSNTSLRVTDMGVIRTFNEMMTALSAQGIQIRLIQNKLPNDDSNPNANPNILLLNEPIDEEN